MSMYSFAPGIYIFLNFICFLFPLDTVKEKIYINLHWERHFSTPPHPPHPVGLATFSFPGPQISLLEVLWADQLELPPPTAPCHRRF